MMSYSVFYSRHNYSSNSHFKCYCNNSYMFDDKDYIKVHFRYHSSHLNIDINRKRAIYMSLIHSFNRNVLGIHYKFYNCNDTQNINLPRYQDRTYLSTHKCYQLIMFDWQRMKCNSYKMYMSSMICYILNNFVTLVHNSHSNKDMYFPQDVWNSKPNNLSN